MKRRIVHLTGLAPLILGSVALLLFSCSQDESPLLAGGGGEAPLRITSVGLLSSEVSAIGGSVATRATTTDPLTTGSIGVFRSQGTNYAEELKNKKFSYTSGSWQPATSADTVYLMTNSVDVCAYYPHNAVYTDKTKIPLTSGKYVGTVDNLAQHDPADICYSMNQSMNGVASSTDLTMNHAMAMVQLSFKRLNYDSDHCKITSITIKNSALVTASTIDITSGTVATSGSTLGSVTWTPGTAADGFLQITETGGEIAQALLVPCTLSGATTLTFAVDGKTMTTTVDAAKLASFQAGKIHRLNCVVHAAGITVEEVSIIDWWKEWETGQEPEFDGNQKDYVELAGCKWALSNLVYTAPYGYSFGSDPSTYGSYLNWNVLTDSYEDFVSDVTDWDLMNDPCSLIVPAGTWVTPSIENFEALIALPYTLGTYNKKNGCWFGTSDATLAAAAPGSYLFLPAAGYRDKDGTPYPKGDFGSYWSRTPNVSGKSCSYLSFYDDCSIGDDRFNVGRSVRCVKRPTDYAVVTSGEVTIGSYTWATANLRTSDAGVNNFEFEKNPWKSGVYPEEKLNGVVEHAKTNLCYWNWGCLKTPFETKSLAENVEWGKTENGTLGDPCAKIAPGNVWKVPSKAQLEDLNNIANLPAENETVWMNGEVFTVKSETGWVENTNNTIQGQVFVANGKAIFLPAAGDRASDGTMNGDGTYGSYWARTPTSSTADYLYFESSYVGISDTSRSFGFSVRCVKASN